MDKEIQFEFDERAAIFEFDGKFTREESELKALDIINRRYRNFFNFRGYTVEDFRNE